MPARTLMLHSESLVATCRKLVLERLALGRLTAKADEIEQGTIQKLVIKSLDRGP